MKIGQLCIKLAGRDANQKCIVVDVIDKNYVLIDGNVRRKKCNIKHVYPLKQVFKIKKGASTSEVQTALKTAGLEIIKKSSPRTKKEKPAKKRKQKSRSEEKPKKEKKKPKAKK